MSTDQLKREAVLSGFFQQLADAFLSGNHEWLSDVYIYPLVIYIEGEISLERTPEKTLANLFERREVVLLAGTQHIRSKLVSVGDATAGRFPVRVNWEFLGAGERRIATNQLRYFCRFDETGRTRIEILEFIKQGFPNRSDRRTAQRH